MAVETDTERAVMLADFGVTLIKGADFITVILDKRFVEFQEIAGYKPIAMARSSDVAALSLVKGDVVTVDGVNYTFQVPMDDGTGFTDLVLEAV